MDSPGWQDFLQLHAQLHSAMSFGHAKPPGFPGIPLVSSQGEPVEMHVQVVTFSDRGDYNCMYSYEVTGSPFSKYNQLLPVTISPCMYSSDI